MYGAVRVEDVCRRSFAHDDVLQSHQTVQQRFRPRRTTWDINVDRYAAIRALHSRVRIEWTACGCTCSHGDGPFWFGHLIVHASDDGTHLERYCPGDDDEIALSRTGTKDAGAKTIDIKSTSASRNHFNRTTGKTERHRPKSGLPRPIDHRCRDINRLRANSPSKRIY